MAYKQRSVRSRMVNVDMTVVVVDLPFIAEDLAGSGVLDGFLDMATMMRSTI